MRKKGVVLFVSLVTAILGLSTSVALLIAPVEGHTAILIGMSLLGICPVILIFFAVIDHIEEHGAVKWPQQDNEGTVYIRGGRAVSRDEFYAKKLPKPRAAKPSQTIRKV